MTDLRAGTFGGHGIKRSGYAHRHRRLLDRRRGSEHDRLTGGGLRRGPVLVALRKQGIARADDTDAERVRAERHGSEATGIREAHPSHGGGPAVTAARLLEVASHSGASGHQGKQRLGDLLLALGNEVHHQIDETASALGDDDVVVHVDRVGGKLPGLGVQEQADSSDRQARVEGDEGRGPRLIIALELGPPKQ